MTELISRWNFSLASLVTLPLSQAPVPRRQLPRLLHVAAGRPNTRDFTPRPKDGAVAQLGERYNGIVEVRGSTPLGSTISFSV